MEKEINMIDTLSTKDKLKQIDDILDSYEQSINIPVCKTPGTEEELQNYLNMSRDQLEKLTPELCGEIKYRMLEFAFYIQRLINKDKSRVIWAQHQLTEIIATDFDKYDKFTKYEIRISLVTKNNEYANSLQKIIIYASQRIQRLEFLTTALKNLADSLKDIAVAKLQLIKGN